jgi:hypothetical protein
MTPEQKQRFNECVKARAFLHSFLREYRHLVYLAKKEAENYRRCFSAKMPADILAQAKQDTIDRISDMWAFAEERESYLSGNSNFYYDIEYYDVEDFADQAPRDLGNDDIQSAVKVDSWLEEYYLEVCLVIDELIVDYDLTESED